MKYFRLCNKCRYACCLCKIISSITKISSYSMYLSATSPQLVHRTNFKFPFPPNSMYNSSTPWSHSIHTYSITCISDQPTNQWRGGRFKRVFHDFWQLPFRFPTSGLPLPCRFLTSGLSLPKRSHSIGPTSAF